MLGFIVTVPVAIVTGVALIFGGLFVGSQIDDRIERPTQPIANPPDELPTVIKWPLLIGGIVLAVILGKKIAKKIMK